MSTNTPNFNLAKPSKEEFYDVNVQNANMDKIDVTLKTIADRITEHATENASLTTSGHVQLSNAIDSTSETLAATPSAVKIAYNRGDEAFNDMTELRAEFLAFKAALTEGFTDNQFSDGLTSLNAFNVTAGYYNLPLTRLEV